MSRLWAIAINTFREAMRNKILYTIVFFACALILSAWAIGQLSMHEEARVTRDLGLGGISIFGVLLAIFVGVNLLYKEIERKTVYALLPKPIDRWHLVVGKFVGMVLTLAAQVALMSVVLALTLAVQHAAFDGVMLRAVVLVFAQIVVVTAIAVLFSSFTTPLLAGFYTAGLFAIGRSLPDIATFVATRVQSGAARAVAHAGLAVLPDLHLFYVSGAVVAGKTVSVNGGAFVGWGYVAWASGYAALYATCALVLAIVIFARRDFV